MRAVFAILVILVIYNNGIEAEEKAKDKDAKITKVPVFEMNEEDFNHSVQHADFFVACFYSSKSRESEKFKPIYEEVAQAVAKENKYIAFCRIDVGKYPNVNKAHVILELPTLKFFKKGRYYDFKGQKTAQHITTWVHLAMNSPLIMSTTQELEDLKKKGTVLVGCFPGDKPEDEFNAFLNVSARFVSAKNIPLPRFAIITKASMSRDTGLQKGTVTIFKDFEDKEKVTYAGPMTDTEKMLKFCEEEGQPAVFPYGPTPYSYQTSHTNAKYQHLLFMSPSDSKFKQTMANFRAAAKNFMKDLNNIEVMFIHVDTTDEQLQRVVSFFHVDLSKDVPCNRMTKKDKFHSRFTPPKTDFSKEGFIDFTKQVMEGKWTRSIRTEKLPADWDKYPLKILVGSNYEEVTRKEGKLVFVMYFVPDDKKCEQTLPVLDEVAMKYKLNKTVTIAVMDVSLNDGEVDVHNEYPNFKLFRADNTVAKYNGLPRADAIETFIDSNGDPQYGGVQSLFDSDISFEFESSNNMDDDPNVINYEEEEQSEHKWTMEELKMIESAVESIEGHQAHDDPDHMVNPHHEEMEEKGIVTDEKDMDPEEHAWHGHHEHDPDHEHVYTESHNVAPEKHKLPRNFTYRHDEQ